MSKAKVKKEEEQQDLQSTKDIPCEGNAYDAERPAELQDPGKEQKPDKDPNQLEMPI